jgi:hypothetical protein
LPARVGRKDVAAVEQDLGVARGEAHRLGEGLTALLADVPLLRVAAVVADVDDAARRGGDRDLRSRRRDLAGRLLSRGA